MGAGGGGEGDWEEWQDTHKGGNRLIDISSTPHDFMADAWFFSDFNPVRRLDKTNPCVEFPFV